MNRANLKKYLEFHISAQDVPSGKPDPAIYLESISRLGLTPQECLILEDNDNGIKTPSSLRLQIISTRSGIEYAKKMAQNLLYLSYY